MYAICQGQSVPEDLRSEVWKACLGIKDSNKQIAFDEIFDLPEQNILREDCQQFVGKCQLLTPCTGICNSTPSKVG